MKSLKIISIKNITKNCVSLIVALTLFGCDSNVEDTPIPPAQPQSPVFKFQLSVTNLTNTQPFSPFAFVMHQDNALWTIGSSASDELELLAESGDNSGIRGLNYVLANNSTEGIIDPGASVDVTLTFAGTIDGRKLSAASMLVNTNDAFTGFTGLDISLMAIGSSRSYSTTAYDSGTESNSELMGTIPGPADMGEGFNSARDDANIVSRHSGVVSIDDGLTASILTEAHRFDNPVALLVVTRLE
jgi:hypothetical protein